MSYYPYKLLKHHSGTKNRAFIGRANARRLPKRYKALKLCARILILVYFSSLVSACVSQIAPFEGHIKSWHGGKIEELIRAKNLPHLSRANYKGKEQVTQLENGNKLYEFPYPDCPVFFEVNSKGIIVKISTEDNRACY